ncbi:MAG: amidohydrolase family protein [candidate division Zixibacteria bacterium]|nr:amidohydrolase family protein [candidate division Zixibacteria bacterium]
MDLYDYQPFDRDIWEKELEGFVPAVIYDMHTHIWSERHRGTLTDPPAGLRLEIDYHAQIDWAADMFPGREMHFLALGTPITGGIDIEGHNAWMAEQMGKDPQSAVHLLVTPDMTPEYIADQVKKHRFLGLKPYRLFAPDPVNCRIADFLPESFIELAHDMGLSITMHLSKPTGCADPENLRDLAYYTRRYPRAQWILAHCARAFNAFMLEDAVHVLKDLPSLWYDTSAVNDLYSHYLLMKHEDRSRVMFGSDNVVAGCARGKYITYGRAWTLYQGLRVERPHCDPRATLVIYEQLRQERQVADMLGLTPGEVEDHFSGNARRFLSLVRGQQTF